jgi:hypothetical protein
MKREPKLFQHLTALYTLLGVESHSKDGSRYYTGSQRKTFDKLELSSAMNPILYRALREMGCIEVVQRGAGGRPSILKLMQPPQIERFVEWNNAQHTTRDLTPRTSLSTIEQRVAQLERRLPSIDLIAWVAGIEGRLAGLEGDGETTKRKRSSTGS